MTEIILFHSTPSTERKNYSFGKMPLKSIGLFCNPSKIYKSWYFGLEPQLGELGLGTWCKEPLSNLLGFGNLLPKIDLNKTLATKV